MFPIKQFSVEKQAVQRPPFFKAGQAISRRFSKAFHKFKSFLHLTAKNLLIQYKIKGIVKCFEYLQNALVTKTHATFSQL
jgi:hypothetical protein